MRGVFSTQAFKNRLKGFETITFVVNESGFPEVLAVTKSLDRALDVYAIDDIAHLRFRPAHKGAEPVAVLLSLHLEAGGEYRDDFPLAPDKSPVIP